MTATPLIAPSLLAADSLNFGSEMAAAEKAGADWHHVDVMDGHFVPNLSYGVPLVKAFKQVSQLPLDVHIMVSNPDEVALDYVKAGADYLVFHIEAARHAHRLVHAIHGAGAKVGIAINPGTPLESLWPVLADVDLVNVMSVNPGFGGQSFIQGAVDRIAKISQKISELGCEGQVKIQVDGGITDKTAPAVVAAGAHVLVAGSYVYGSSDRAARIATLKQAGG